MYVSSNSVLFLAGALALVPGVAGAADKDALAAKAQQILKANCYRCHGQEGSVEGGMNYVSDVAALISRKKVIPGDVGKSPLYRRVTHPDDPMPPAGERTRPSASEVATLKQWIDAGAPAVADDAPARTALSPNIVIQLINDDIRKLNERNRKFARYFTISHLYSAGLSEEELQTYRNALAKLVNSLSWESEIVLPKAIDPAKTIFRIDLRDYRWTPEVWNKIVAEYPFGVRLTIAGAKTAYAAAETEVPAVRADWFVFAASKPPLYHDLLQLPKTDKELEKDLRIDVSANIDGERVARAGFNGSGVSRNNRLIERHRISTGSYWKSYDFAGGSGRQNLFASPLGPGSESTHFQHDGGEIIFSLPNGLQAYMLVDAQGNRLDKGPVNIVTDAKRPDRMVENGISCMSCHTRGLIDKADQIREHAQKNLNAFAKKERESILALYPPADKFSALIRDDAKRYADAVLKTGGKVGGTEPVVALAQRYEAEMDVAAVAAEVGLGRPEFLRRLDGSPTLSRTLGSLKSSGGTVQRETFIAAFPDCVRELKLGEYLGPNAAATPAVPMMPADPTMPPVADNELRAPTVIKLNAAMAGFLLTKDGKHLYLLNTSEGKVQRVDTAKRQLDSAFVQVSDGTVAICANPSFRSLFTCSPGKVQVISPLTMKLTSTIAVPVEPFDITAHDAGLVYVFPAKAGLRDRGVAVIDPARKAVVNTLQAFYESSYLRLHPSGTKLFYGTTGVSPGNFHCIPFPTGKERAVSHSSPYHGDHPLGGQFELTPDGSFLVAQTGIILRLARTKQDDMKFAGKVEPHTACTFEPKLKLALVAARDGTLRVYSYPDFDLKRSYNIGTGIYKMTLDPASKQLYCAVATEKENAGNPRFNNNRVGPGDIHIYDVSPALKTK